MAGGGAFSRLQTHELRYLPGGMYALNTHQGAGPDPMGRRLRLGVVWSLGLGIVAAAGGCFPQVGDPNIFEEEISALRSDWGDSCEDRCGGPDEPFACKLPLDSGECMAFDQTAALNCFATFRKLVRKDICGANTQSMQNLEADCVDVYVTCETEGDTGTGTDGGTDTGGTTGA